MQDETENMPAAEDEAATPAPVRRRRYINRRNAAVAGGLVLIVGIAAVVLIIVLYRNGTVDNYLKAQFVSNLADMNIVFDADVFRVTVNPLQLELENATFNDKVSGEKLFSIRSAHLQFSVTDLYAWSLNREISLDKTDIDGAEVWVKFDQNGRSNFDNIRLVENEPHGRVSFRYQSANFIINNSVVHFGDQSRDIGGNANNVSFTLTPKDLSVPDDQKRYDFDLIAKGSDFRYNTGTVEKIDIHASGIADHGGAEIHRLDVTTPIGETYLSGVVLDWADPRYSFDIQSSVDLTQASNIFAAGTSLVGVGNFKGKLSGQGETYRIEGQADAQSLRAAGVYLKALNVAATVAGSNSDYEANGTAIAEMLTFEDFRVDFVKLIGNIRGTGTDFRWVGELQAAAAKSKDLSLGGLFLKDAVAEYRDRELNMQAGYGTADRLQTGDVLLAKVRASDLRASTAGDSIHLTSPSAQAASLSSKDYDLKNVTGRNVDVQNRGRETSLRADNIRSTQANIGGADIRNLSADKFALKDHPSTTEFTASNVRADGFSVNGAAASGVDSPEVRLEDSPAETVIYADTLHVAKLDAGAAILGSLNIGGVRLTVRQGTVEARSNDIDAGNVVLAKSADLPEGGTLNAVKIARPVFVLEPSDRYRATADMSIGGGAIGSIALGAARANVEASSDRVALHDLTANVMSGQVAGEATIGLGRSVASSINGTFTNLDVSKLLSLQGGSVVPIQGQTMGNVALTFTGTNLRNASGTVDAGITATAGTADKGLIPVNGQVKLTANNGLFNVDVADLRTQNSEASATGRFDLRDNNSDLAVTLHSTDASEISRIVSVLDLSPELSQQMNDMQVSLAGNLNFTGRLTGNFTDPVVTGHAALDSLTMRGQVLGSVATDLNVSPTAIALTNGRMQDPTGGTAAFNVDIPLSGQNNTSVTATLTNVNAGNLLAALPFTLPERISDFTGQTSGTVNIHGLPNNAEGEVDLTSRTGVIAGQNFDGLAVKAVFTGTRIELQQAQMNIGAGRFAATGSYDRGTDAFNLNVTGTSLPATLAASLLADSRSLPPIAGDITFTAAVTGTYGRESTYNANFSGTANNVVVNQQSVGQVTFRGQTADQVLRADLTAALNGRPQVINASLNFGDPNLPFTVSTDFNQSPVEPFLAFVPSLKDVPITGTGTGRINFGGNLRQTDANGTATYTTDNLSGTAEFSQLALQIQDTPLSALEPVRISFNTHEINFERARFGGGGSNMTIAGVKALTAAGNNDLSITGRINLALLNLVSKDTFFTGFADASIRIAGPNTTARLTGTANVVNASVATFLGSGRLTVDKLSAKLIFTTDQLEIEQATGYLGGGKFTASGGGTINGLSVQAFRLGIDGTNVTVPLPQDFTTTGDAQLEITGQRRTPTSDLRLNIAGRIYARRALYTKDIELANFVGGRGESLLSGSGPVSANSPRLDLTIEGRDALIVKNNIADLTASVSLALTGSADNPQVSGRITATNGTIFFRKDRYDVQRGVLEFPPNQTLDPIINLQAEAEIAGYQVFIDLNGPLMDTESLTANVRSNPALPQADVVSLITTGNLANVAGGIPTLAQTGINTAAEVLTDAIINQPVRKATDRLFGLNVFEIDPIISGQQLNPTARLTVGRQINNNLRVTYSTNLSQDQQQVLALEYRVSNKLSLVAQYEQRSLTNVTRNRNNFSFEVRFRKRF